jgi:hypothetical protein
MQLVYSRTMRIVLLLLLSLPSEAKPPSDACEAAGQCMLIPKSCCGFCGTVKGDDVRAVNAETWEGDRPECAGKGCPDCHDGRAYQMVAVCEKKRCKVLKLDQLPITKCKQDSDCVTVSVGCCGGAAVAVRKDQSEKLWTRMCGEMGVGCDRAHRPPLPKGYCSAGRCAVDER